MTTITISLELLSLSGAVTTFFGIYISRAQSVEDNFPTYMLIPEFVQFEYFFIN